MPRWIEDLTIDRKLMAIMMLTVGIALVAACLTFVVSDALATYRSVKSELSTLAGIVANNSVGALDFDDAAVARETLASLASNEGITSGCLVDRDGGVLARYTRRGGEADCRSPGDASSEPRFEAGRIVIRRPVVFKNETLGALVLRADLSRLRARVAPYLIGTLLALGVSSALALALSSRLKNLITAPILQLVGAVHEVSGSQRYATRVSVSSRDEIGQLMGGFNEMLEQIELRDAALTRAHDELEDRVAQRTAELEVARDAAQDASRAKSEFLANMSHEIRTPLNAVMGLTDVLLGTRLDERQTDFLVTVRDSADALLSVLNDILDFSKIEAGKLDLERVHFDIHDTVDDTLTALALRAEAKGLELACYVDPALPTPLLGDPGRLRQILSNLVSNAVKFTEVGEVVVRVMADGPVEGSARLRFTVRDTGIGIPPEKLERLFDPFEQADTSTTRRYGGTGLGLSISRQLAEMMDGEIGAESTPGAGSTFHFTARFDVPDRARIRPAEEPAPLEGVRVLLVDDNDTNRTILNEVTIAKGMRPFAARSADEAIGLLDRAHEEGDPFQLVVSDVHMPDADGFMLVERIRRDARLAGLPVVFLTSAGQTGDLERCEALGVASRLVKPIKQSELYQVMTRALGVEGVPARLASAPDLPEPVASPPLATSLPSLPPLRILLVEDSPANRKVALAMLGGMGHSFEIAANGREALDLLAQQSFDVVLMDVQMPEMDGLEATAAIRAGESGTASHVPIIAMTAHALRGDREKCLAAGMDEYVAKPIRRVQLLEALRRTVATGETGADPTPPRPAAARARPSAGGVIRGAPLFQELGGEVDVLHEVVDAYVTETLENLRRLPGLIASGASDDVRRLAHTLKGAMRSLGATDAARESFALEELARAGDLTAASAVLQRVDLTVSQVLPDWVGFLESGVIPD